MQCMKILTTDQASETFIASTVRSHPGRRLTALPSEACPGSRRSRGPASGAGHPVDRSVPTRPLAAGVTRLQSLGPLPRCSLVAPLWVEQAQVPDRDSAPLELHFTLASMLVVVGPRGSARVSRRAEW